MHRRGAALAALALALGLLIAAPSGVSACTSEHPTFAEAVQGARAIARVTVVEGFEVYTADPTISETYRVERVLKGELPGLVTLAPAWTSLCHDSVGYYAQESVGKTLVVAIDLPYYDQVIHPMWTTYDSQGVSGSAGVPSGASTLDELEAAILAELGLPDTSTDEPPPRGAFQLGFIIAAALLAFIATMRRSGHEPIRDGKMCYEPAPERP